MVNLVRALPNEEEPARNQDEISATDFVLKNREERGGEPRHPSYRHQQEHPCDHGEAQSDKASPRLLFRWQLPGENRDEYDIVDAEHDLEHAKRHKGNGEFSE